MTPNPRTSVFALLADPATHGGDAVSRIDTHAAVGVPGRHARFQGQARGALSVPRLFDAREAQGRLRGGASRSTGRSRPRYTAAWCRSRARRTGGLQLDGGGTPVEWAVEMRRFDENATLDRLAEAGKIDATLADALGRAVAAGACRRRRRSRPSPGSRRSPTISTRTPLRSARCRDLFPRAEAEALADASRARPRAHPSAPARARPAAGSCGAATAIFISATSCCIDGRPVLFDAIEFDPLIAAGDVLYDLAFLLMDLVERGLEPCGQHRVQPLSRRDKAGRGSRRPRRPAAVSLDAGRDPRQGDGGTGGRMPPPIARPRSSAARALISTSPAASSRRHRRSWSRSAGSPAPANRRSRVRWRRTSDRRRGRSCCAPTSSARRCSARTSTTSCRPTPIRPR